MPFRLGLAPQNPQIYREIRLFGDDRRLSVPNACSIETHRSIDGSVDPALCAYSNAYLHVRRNHPMAVGFDGMRSTLNRNAALTADHSKPVLPALLDQSGTTGDNTPRLR